jgi:hypothetical protein
VRLRSTSEPRLALEAGEGCEELSRASCYPFMPAGQAIVGSSICYQQIYDTLDWEKCTDQHTVLLHVDISQLLIEIVSSRSALQHKVPGDHVMSLM